MLFPYEDNFQRFSKESYKGEMRNWMEYIEWDINWHFVNNNWHIVKNNTGMLSTTTDMLLYISCDSYYIFHSLFYSIPHLTVYSFLTFPQRVILQQACKYQRTWLQV